MEKKAIFTEAMHKSAAPAPHALQVGDVIYISGKIGFTNVLNPFTCENFVLITILTKIK